MNVTSPGGNTLTVNPVGKPRQEILQVPPVTVTATVAEARQQPVNPIQIQVSWGDITGKPNFGSASLRDSAQPNATAGPGEVVLGSDPRMTNARPPTAHTHTLGQITDMSDFGRAWAQLPDVATAASTIGVPSTVSPLAINAGGTGATTAAGARSNLGALAKAGDSMTGQLGLATPASVASAANIDLSAVTSNFININGSTGISGITAPAGRFFWATFVGGPSLTFTHSAFLSCPRGQNYTAVTGDVLFIFMAAPNVAKLTVLSRSADFVRRSGDQMEGALDPATELTVASAATVDLSTLNGNDIKITGTTNISSFGTAAPFGTTRNLRFIDAAPGGLVCGDGSTVGTIGAFQGTTEVGGLFRCYTNDVVTVKKFDNGVWYIVNVSNLAFNSQVWEKIADWVPTSVQSISFFWDAARYRRVRIGICGVRMAGTGTANDILYARVYQNSVLKSVSGDYWAQGAYWNASTGTILTGSTSIMHMSIGGQNASPEELHGEFLLDCPLTARGGMHGQSRYLTFSAERGVAVFGHQILVSDAAINGIFIGWAGGGGYLAGGFGSIVLEGLRR